MSDEERTDLIGVDAGTRRFLAELDDLLHGRSESTGAAKAVCFKGSFVALFAEDAQPGERAGLVVRMEPAAELAAMTPGQLVTFYGVPEIGHAVAIAVGDDLYFPLMPAKAPSWRTPKLPG